MPRKAQVRWPTCQECLGDGIDIIDDEQVFCPACGGRGEWDAREGD